MRHWALTVLLLAGAVAWSGCGDDQCKDQDGDGFFGADSNCSSGRDCDDSSSDVHPGADEICDNGRDDDCDGQVDECGDGPGGDTWSEAGTDADADGTGGDRGPICVDADGDGWGVAGKNGACPEQGADCDDLVPSVHPGADETCNGRDDDCDGEIDECAAPMASCQSIDGTERCVSPVGGSCESSKNCPERAVCDGGVDPPECRKIRGETCSLDEECRSSLECSVGRCSGDYCSKNSCSGDRPFCDDSSQSCVECRYWYDDPPGDLPDCAKREYCLGKGACGESVLLDDTSGVSPFPTVTRDQLVVARELAKCWRSLKDGDPAMCVGFRTTSALSDPVTEQEIRDAYSEFDNARSNGNLQKISEQNVESLGNLLGDGITNLDNLSWDRDIPPKSNREVCAWFQTHTSIPGEKLHVGACDAFSW